jgi:hypothetical protein
MKLKKFFAGVLAAAMMLTVGATAAFATTGVDATYPGTAGEYNANMFVPVNGKAEIDLTKILTVANGTAPDSMKFNFNVYEGTATTGTALDTKSVEFNAGNYTSNGGENNKGVYTGTFKLDVAKLTEGKPVGKYTFTIVESMDKAYQSVIAERGTVTMVISKVNAKEVDATATAEFGYFVALKDSEGNKILATEAFKNTYGDNNISELTLKKVVKGSFGDLGEKFTFEVKFTKATGKTYSNILVDSKSSNDVDDVSIVKKDTTEQVTELRYDETYVVTLKHNQWIKFNNVASDVEYAIVENKKDNWQYTTSLQDGSNANFTKATMTAAGTTKASASTDTFINDHQGTPDMGVVLDNAPYIAMLAIVAIGGVALMLNKRRRDEE